MFDFKSYKFGFWCLFLMNAASMMVVYHVYNNIINKYQIELISTERKLNVCMGGIKKLEYENHKLKNTIPEFSASSRKIIKSLQRPITIYQGIDKNDLRQTITKVLEYLSEKNIEGYVELLMVTAQAESDLGRIRKQRRGPALGVFQIEPTTEKCNWNNYLKYNNRLREKIKALMGESAPGLQQLQTNLEYAITMAYIKYKRLEKESPKKNDIVQLVKLYKKLYNTEAGKATVEKTLLKVVGTL